MVLGPATTVATSAETGIDIAKILQGANQKAGTDRNDDGERHLSDDERIAKAHAPAGRSFRHRRGAFLQRRIHIDARGAASWS